MYQAAPLQSENQSLYALINFYPNESIRWFKRWINSKNVLNTRLPKTSVLLESVSLNIDWVFYTMNLTDESVQLLIHLYVSPFNTS